jgi:hypothetical protein
MFLTIPIFEVTRKTPFLFSYFLLDQKVTKTQDLLLFFYTPTFYSTHKPRPQALWILAAP